MPSDPNETTVRGFDAALIEAMASAVATPAFDPLLKSETNMPHLVQARRFAMKYAEAALTALCAARPDVAALLAGEAVAVPKEPTEALIQAWNANVVVNIDDRVTSYSEARGYRAMLAASPYAND